MKISIIGAGNVATHLAKRCYVRGHQIVQVFNRNLAKAEELAAQVAALATDNYEALLPAEVYLLAVRDDVIAVVAEQLQEVVLSSAVVAHVSGATTSRVLSPFFEHFGVFYPLQTFSVGKAADFDTLPLCIDGNSDFAKAVLLKLGHSICLNIYEIDDQKRATLHVAAVFANNFTNFLFAISEDIAKNEGLPFELLKPLIVETVEKIRDNTPKTMQTGPARRGDKATLQQHATYLERYPDYQEIYKLLSENIEKRYF